MVSLRIVDLALSVMCISLIEQIVKTLAAIFVRFYETRAVFSKAAASYYQRAEKEINDEAATCHTIRALELELCLKLKEFLDSEMERRKAKKGGVVDGSAGGDEKQEAAYSPSWSVASTD
jgi:hypothetical protein